MGDGIAATARLAAGFDGAGGDGIDTAIAFSEAAAATIAGTTQTTTPSTLAAGIDGSGGDGIADRPASAPAPATASAPAFGGVDSDSDFVVSGCAVCL